MRKVIISEKAPKAIGPYSAAIETETFIFTSGQLGLDPVSGELVQGGIEAETRQAIKNLFEVLKSSGSDLNSVVKTTVFLKDIGEFPLMNKIYGEYFINEPPARSAFQVAALPKNACVEIEAIAVKKNLDL
ncbi:MAG: reactive intermediate/imine deaminase [Chloroflexi bacterium HGW-Chloroflexi-3]|nr:MAG: reactive intermediate/imine deaminase [Chloroflexi bacterium HGW-Chloroflexi-3]